MRDLFARWRGAGCDWRDDAGQHGPSQTLPQGQGQVVEYDGTDRRRVHRLLDAVRGKSTNTVDTRTLSTHLRSLLTPFHYPALHFLTNVNLKDIYYASTRPDGQAETVCRQDVRTSVHPILRPLPNV